MKDITFVPDDYIVEHTKTSMVVAQNADTVVFDVAKAIKPILYCANCKEWDGITCFLHKTEVNFDDYCSMGRSEDNE